VPFLKAYDLTAAETAWTMLRQQKQ